jgi:molybdopterin converting factor small subunit
MVRNEELMETTAPEVRVAIPPALRPLCAGPAPLRRGELRLVAHDVRALLAELARQQPQVHARICDEGGEPRPHINVFINDDHITARAGLETRLVPGDLVTILPAVSGG